jgi:hypothetical protein
LVSKRLGLLHELVPKATVVAYIVNQNGLNYAVETRRAQGAGRSFGPQ